LKSFRVICVALLGFSQTSEFTLLMKLISDITNAPQDLVTHIVNAFIVIAFIYNEFRDPIGVIFSPNRRPAPHPKELPAPVLNNLLQAFNDLNSFPQYKERGWKFSINVMTIKPKWGARIEPFFTFKGKSWIVPSIYTQVFKIVWSHNYTPIKGFEISVNQGVCGHSYNKSLKMVLEKTSYQDVVCRVIDYGKQKWNLSQKQIDATSKIKLIASCPIRPERIKKIKSFYVNGGMLNVESESDFVEEIATNKELRNGFTAMVAAMAEIYSEAFVFPD
jgi:hypothetical protein